MVKNVACPHCGMPALVTASESHPVLMGVSKGYSVHHDGMYKEVSAACMHCSKKFYATFKKYVR